MNRKLFGLLLVASFLFSGAVWAQLPSTSPDEYLDVPPEVPGTANEEEPEPGGILEEPDADSVVFVVDRSCSMGWGSTSIEVPGVPGANPWQAAQYELNRAIDNLDGDSQFSVILFNHSFVTWRTALQVADEGNKSAARGWVSSQYSTGGTTYTAPVSAGINIGAGPPEVIMFLSDGMPNEGSSAVGSISAANGGRCVINTVAFGVSIGGMAFQIMNDIANQNGGEIRIVQ